MPVARWSCACAGRYDPIMGLFDGTSLERPVTCARCGAATSDCACPKDATGQVCPPSQQAARVQREKRRGKWVTVVRGLDPSATDLPKMLKQAKAACAAGGTTTADGFELQGDHRDRLLETLKKAGYPAKASGG